MSKTHLHFPPILHLSLLFLLHIVTAQSPDIAPMLQLKKSLTFPNSSWWTDPNPCNWEHIRCTNNRVNRVQIGGCHVQGILPDAVISKLSELAIFEVMRNQLTGPLPSFSGLSNLQHLLLNENQFTSIPDDFFRGLTSLISVSLDKNQFGQWKIPESLKDASALQSFSANYANITGSIPRYFGASGGLASLTTLRLAHNNLEGGLPDEFAGSSIQSLWLNGQLSEAKLGGSIAVLGKMTSLVDVWLHQNMFSGPIPDVSGLNNLRVLSLRDNQLTGPVPESLVNLVSLKSVNLTNNLLQGKKPKFGDGVLVDDDPLNRYCLDTPGVECDWRVNVFLDIAKPLGYPVVFAQNWDGNDPCGWSGVNCDSAKKNVTLINFQNKGLKGPIAPDYSKFTTLEKLFLNNNNFTGAIPNALVNLTNLKILDVSFNDLSGQVPKFSENVLVKVEGTKIVIGDPPASAPGGNSDKVAALRSWKHKIIGIVVGSVGGFLIICLALFFVLKRRNRINKVQSPNTNTMVIHPRLSGSDQDIKITIAGVRGGGSEGASHTSSGPSASAGDVHVVESGNMVISIQVLRNVTNNFSEENILGRGGFGIVYKGELHDGTKIAVKRMESGAMSDKGLNEFQAEIAVLTKVRHRHLVALLGYCLEGNERLLVYEYMPQGTLSSHLFNWVKENLKPLEWSRRLTIALDVARGVEYLHSLAHQSFVHRDLKPSNILLGDDMRAKVADFGLVRLAPDGKMSFATKLAGTFGYLAPEYAATGRVTTKVDVFSFGVILMELITGRKALDDSQPEESCHLVTWFRRMNISQDDFQKAVDPVIDLNEEILSSIRTVAELAGHCTAREPYQRPNMSHAVNTLSSLAEMWKPTEQDADDIYGIDLDMTLPQALKKWQEFEGNSNADLSSSSFFGGNSSAENTQTSIPTRPYGFGDSFTSTDGR